MGKMAHTRGHLKNTRFRPHHGSQILRGAQQGIDYLIRDQQQLEFDNGELRGTIRRLRAELADAKGRARSLESTERRLSDYIQKVIEERDVANRRVKELENTAETKRQITPPTNDDAKRLKRAQTLEEMKRAEAAQGEVLPYRPQPMTPAIATEVKEEHSDSDMTSDDEEPSVPGLPLVEDGLTKDIAEQLIEAMKCPKLKKRLELFLKRGERNTYFCAHKILKGKMKSKPVLPKEACPGPNCKHNFRVRVVDSDSGVKLYTAPYTPMY